MALQDIVPPAPRHLASPNGAPACGGIGSIVTSHSAVTCPRCLGDTKDFANAVRQECAAIATMLIEKNKAYGNSALDPVRIFSKADTVEQLKVRIDDKLSRLMRGEAAGEDTVRDLIGYLVLLRLASAT